MAHSRNLPLPRPVAPGRTSRPAERRSRRPPGNSMRSTHEASSSRVERWVNRFIPGRGPVVGDHLLTRSNVYVLPSRAGALFAMVLLAMLICSINYGLALGYGLSFLIFGIAIVGMMHTVRNMSALTLRAGRADPVFAGRAAEVSFLVLNPSRLARFALWVHAPAMKHDATFDIAARTEQIVHIALATQQRGWLQVPRLTLSTRYPLGIWRVWTHWQPAQSLLVYPEPEQPAFPLPASRSAHGDNQGVGSRDEDLATIRPFMPGDSPRRIAWSAIARTGTDEMLTKQFEGGGSGELVLDFDQLPAHLPLEDRLSRLTRWILDAENAGASYALLLPGQSLAADHGPTHQADCLKALALFGIHPGAVKTAPPLS